MGGVLSNEEMLRILEEADEAMSEPTPDEASSNRPAGLVWVETDVTSREAAEQAWQSAYEKYGLPIFVTAPSGSYEKRSPRTIGAELITKPLYDELVETLPPGEGLVANWNLPDVPKSPSIFVLAIEHEEPWTTKIKTLHEVFPDGTQKPVTKDTWYSAE